MVKHLRFEISKKIAISHPKVVKKCFSCKSLVSGYATILYADGKETVMYDWLHISCIGALSPSENIQGQSYKYRKCSYCGAAHHLLKFPSFYLHRDCGVKIINKVNEIMEINAVDIVAGCI